MLVKPTAGEEEKGNSVFTAGVTTGAFGVA